MKKTTIRRMLAAVVGSCLIAFGLAGCSSGSGTGVSAENPTVTVAVTAGYYEELVQTGEDMLSSYGVDCEVTEYGSTEEALDALNNNEVDCALVTDLPHVTAYNEANGTDLTVKTALTFARMGVYSSTYTSLDALPDGATVALPSDVTSQNRALRLLADNGLITLSSSAGTFTATTADITANTKNLSFVTVDETTLASSLASYDAAVIPYYVAESGGLDCASALASESTTGSASWEYADYITIRNDGEAVDTIDKLNRALQESDVSTAITEKFGDAVVLAYAPQEFFDDPIETSD